MLCGIGFALIPVTHVPFHCICVIRFVKFINGKPPFSQIYLLQKKMVKFID